MRSRLDPLELIDPALSALNTGNDLMTWWNGRQGENSLQTIPLVRPAASLLEMSGFFSLIADGGQSVMGCLQRTHLGGSFRDAVEGRFEAIPKRFASLCRWERRAGEQGGFTYTPLLRKRLGEDTPETVPAGTPLDFSLEGLDWLVARVDIHDFVRAVLPLAPLAGLLSRVVREAAFVVVHRNFAVRETASPGRPFCSFGYSFLPVAPEPSPFGFGPGHFGAAIKQFRFSESGDGGLEVSLAFIVSPRSEEVLDLGGFDPVYSISELADRLSLRKFNLGPRIHDRMDASMLRLHGKVHHRLLVDMETRLSAATAGLR